MPGPGSKRHTRERGAGDGTVPAGWAKSGRARLLDPATAPATVVLTLMAWGASIGGPLGLVGLGSSVNGDGQLGRHLATLCLV
jgi:hypothetical protein